jgi:hypothetical protein
MHSMFLDSPPLAAYNLNCSEVVSVQSPDREGGGGRVAQKGVSRPMVEVSTGKQRRSRLNWHAEESHWRVERHGIARYSIG